MLYKFTSFRQKYDNDHEVHMMNYKAIADRMGGRVGATQEWVFQVLRQGIIDGELPGGTQLKQDEISAALNVSHIPVREALRRLEAQGLVTIHPNRGASVTKLTRDDLLGMMEVRATLAAMQFRKGAPLLTEEDYQTLEQIIAAQRSAQDLFECEELNYKFHNMFSKHEENAFASLLMEIIHANTDRYMRSSFYGAPETRETSLQQHEQILAACRQGEYERACELLREHILDAKSYMPAELK